MVFNSLTVLTVAHVSADAWQRLACIQDRLSGHQLLDLICCFPLQQLGRFALCLWTFLCLPPPDSFYTYAYYSDSDSDSDGDQHHHHHHPGSSSSVDFQDYYYDSHSD